MSAVTLEFSFRGHDYGWTNKKRSHLGPVSKLAIHKHNYTTQLNTHKSIVLLPEFRSLARVAAVG